MGSYGDHMTSTSGLHYKHLSRSEFFQEGANIAGLRHLAWEHWTVEGGTGAVRFKYLGDSTACHKDNVMTIPVGAV